VFVLDRWNRSRHVHEADVAHQVDGESTAGGSAPRRSDLDGLRGIAVLLVIAYHYGVPGSGFLGVDIFFVLSGYLITSILHAEWLRTGTVDYRRFWVRRGLRILPAFWLMLAVVALTTSLAQILISLSFFENWSMALDLWPVEWALSPTWSLAMEWQFYLIWPFVLVFALSRWRPRIVALGALLLACASALWRSLIWDGDWVRVFAGPDTHADGLLFGAALALGVTVSRALWPLLLFALVPTPFSWIAHGGMLLAVIGAAAVISHPPRILLFGPLVATGRISYGLYLWHLPVGVWIVNHGIGSPVLALLVTVLVATLSWRFLESPLQRKGRSVAGRIPGGYARAADSGVEEVSVSPA
jgi:peptidoglycan/LPS O-acetylase OafA/YrhL